MNKQGHRDTLKSHQFGNLNAARHGVFSRRTLAPRAREIAEGLLHAEHTTEWDRMAAEEIGSLVAILEAIDEDIMSRGITDRRGNVRSLVDLRNRMSGRLQRWLREFGCTPASRADLVERLRPPEAIADVVRSEVAEGLRLLEAARSRGDIAAGGGSP